MRPIRHLWRVVLFASLCCSATPAQEFPLQQEGKFLNPPNLTTQSDRVLMGMTIGSVPGFPLSANVEAENIGYDAAGKMVTKRFRSRIYRDSKGRTRLEWDMTPVGDAPKAGWFMIDIFDPTTMMSIRLQPSVHTASKWRVPAPGEKPEHLCKASDFPDIDPKVLAQIVAPVPQVSQNEVEHGVIDGMVVRHGQDSLTFPPQPSGKHSTKDMVTDYWFSQQLQLYVLVKRRGPGNTRHVIKLTDIARAEPDASLFAIPAGYVVSEPQPWDGDCRPKLML
jgi:hypothetical protein